MISTIRELTSRSSRHRRLPLTSQSSVTAIKPERKFFILRIVQLILVFGYVPCVVHSSTHTGRWTYASIGTAVALGSGAAALTCVLEMVYLCTRRQTLRRSALQSHSERICYLVLRMSCDACAATLWLSAFIAALLPKRHDYQGFLQSPPYGTWVASVFLALTECVLFVASTYILLIIYRKEPIPGYSHHGQGIELGRHSNTRLAGDRSTGIPTIDAPSTS